MSNELHLVARTIDGTRILTEKWKDGHFIESELPRLAHALHATLVLVRERLALVDCAIRDTLDPRYLFHPENQAFEATPGDDGDVVLKAWGARRTAAKLKVDAERAAHHLEVLTKRRKRGEEDGS
jgi:hypothetical protein